LRRGRNQVCRVRLPGETCPDRQTKLQRIDTTIQDHRMRFSTIAGLMLTVAWAPARGDEPAPFPGPLDPQAALKSLHVRPGFQAELMAAETLTLDPIAFAWGPDGKLWIVEMGDYPSGVGLELKPGGVVR